MAKTGEGGVIRYAAVGLGWITQAALLPGFANAKKNSKLTALVSDDPAKLEELGKYYKVDRLYSYEEYDRCLADGQVDAVYIGLPNTLHRDYTERAARAGVHVLCEKPMATTEADCEAMIGAADRGGIKLMIAYRLHFEAANLAAIEVAESGQLGAVRYFVSAFSEVVEAGNIRLKPELGGGPLWDIGVYCINAARYLFRAEPVEVVGVATKGTDPRFAGVEESASAILKFPGDRLASFTCSFGGADVASYRVVGTEGDLLMDPAYGFEGELKSKLTIGGKSKEHTFKVRDQFGAQLLYFSDCILRDQEPEPSGAEGLADVRIIRALQRSADSGRPEPLAPFERKARPTIAQKYELPAVSPPKMVHAEGPSGD